MANPRPALFTLGLLSLLSAPASAQVLQDVSERKLDMEATASDASYGTALASVGDLDGDGHAEILVGAPLTIVDAVIEAGCAVLYSGATGLELDRIDGTLEEGRLGTSVAGVGDVNGDGVPDLLVGAPYHLFHLPAEPGRALLVSGLDRTELDAFDGDSAGDLLGFAVAGAGDLDGDGVPDLALGAPRADPDGKTNAGSVRLVSGDDGAPLGELPGPTDLDNLGFAVASAGDVDGDGVPDILAGAPSADVEGVSGVGSAFVFSGATGEVLRDVHGEDLDDNFGYSVACAGDVDLDGTPDILVGAPFTDLPTVFSTGSAYVFSGATGAELSALRMDGAATGEQLGFSVTGLGDMDGDGTPDLATGAPVKKVGEHTNAGTAYVHSGATGNALMEVNGEGVFFAVGTSLANPGDVDGDGLAEVLVGAAGGGVSGNGFAALHGVDDDRWVVDLGQRLSGSLEAAQTDDIWFFAPESAELTLTVKGGKAGLEPEVTIATAGGAGLADAGDNTSAKPNAYKLKKLAVESTGLHRLQITGAGGTAGDYTVKTKSKSVAKHTETLPVGDEGATRELADVVPGSELRKLTIKVIAPQGDFAQVDGQPAALVLDEDSVVLHAPGGGTVDLGEALKLSKKGNSAKLSKLALDEVGTYRLEILGAEASVGWVKLTSKLMGPKGKGKVEEP